MTGPEHFREAERLLDGPHNIGDPDAYQQIRMENVATAQVHATLALAAATAAAQATAYDGDEQHQRSRGWAGVA